MQLQRDTWSTLLASLTSRCALLISAAGSSPVSISLVETRHFVGLFKEPMALLVFLLCIIYFCYNLCYFSFLLTWVQSVHSLFLRVEPELTDLRLPSLHCSQPSVSFCRCPGSFPEAPLVFALNRLFSHICDFSGSLLLPTHPGLFGSLVTCLVSGT